MKKKSLRDLVREYERLLAARTLAANNGDKDRTAKALGMTRRGFDRLVLRHRLDRSRFARVLPIGRVDDEREA